MNQRVKRAIATAMSLTMVATATPVSPLYNAIQNAVSSVMMQTSATSGEDIFADYANKEKFSLSSIDDLNAFAEAVNTGKDFSGKTVELADNFDMGDAEFTTPIGTSTAKFMGTFDGNNKTIKLNINQTTDYAGLFGFVQGATIRNVTVIGSVKGNYNVGGICGYPTSNSNVYNCTNNAEITGVQGVGGICGTAYTNCIVYNCTNNAAVEGSSNCVGGICGATSKSNLYNCTNKATVKGSSDNVGGICGYSYDSIMYNCTNKATVKGSSDNVGGICGYAYTNCKVYNCTNNAAVTSITGSYAGGICGNVLKSSNVYNCINTNNTVTGTSYVGGIYGSIANGCEVDKCFSVDTDGIAGSEGTGVTEITAEQLAGTDKVSDNKTVTELLNEYVAENSEELKASGIELVNWKQKETPVLLIYKNIENTKLRWAFDGDTLYIDSQKNAEPTGNFDVPAFGDNAPWKDLINKIRFVDISSSVTGVSDTSFTNFNGQAILVLENGSTLTPTAVEGSNYDTLGGGKFIYSKSQLTGASLSLAGKIGVNVSYYTKAENPTIKINDKEINLEDCTSKNNIYTYTLWVAPKDAYNDIIFKTEKEGLIIVNQTFNVKSNYVDAVFKDDEHETYSEDVYNMVSALDTYIKASGMYFAKVDTTDAIKKEIDDALENLDTNRLNEYAPTIASGSVEGIKYYGSSLILDSGVKLRHYIKVTNEADISNFKVNNLTVTDGKIIKSNIKSDSYDVYYFETDEFNPLNYDTNLSVTYDDINVINNYSVLSYIKLALNKNADSKLGTICKALYNYYLEAKDFKN